MEARSKVLESGDGFYPDVSRIVWRVSGPRAIDALHGLLTNDLRACRAGEMVPCLALDAKGHPLADVRVWRLSPEDGGVLLDVPAAGAEALRDHFGRYLPPRFAAVQPLPGAALSRILGPRAGDAVRRAFGPDTELPQPDRFLPVSACGGGTTGTDADDEPALLLGRTAGEGGGWDLLTSSAADPCRALVQSAVEFGGGRTFDRRSWDIWRVENGLPEYGRDYGIANLPQETGLVERTVSFEKGCYTGQEVVARIHYRGKVNRRIVGLRHPEPGTLREGDELYLEGRKVGHPTTVALSPRFGPIALGMIRREASPGDRLATSASGPPTIEIHDIPFTDT